MNKKVFFAVFAVAFFCMFFAFAQARSSASCRQTVYPPFFGVTQSCPIDVSGIEGLPYCVFSPDQVELVLEDSQEVQLQCIAGVTFTCTYANWEILKSGQPYSGTAVEVLSDSNEAATFISHDTFDENEFYSVFVTVDFYGYDFNCSAPLSSYPAGAISDDQYRLSINTFDWNGTEKTVFVQGTDLNFTAVYDINSKTDIEASGADLNYAFKEDTGAFIFPPTTVKVFGLIGNPKSGRFSTVFDISTLNPGNYIVEGLVYPGPKEKYFANNRAQKYISIIKASEKVGVPETNFFLVALIGLIVAFLAKSTKNTLN